MSQFVRPLLGALRIAALEIGEANGEPAILLARRFGIDGFLRRTIPEAGNGSESILLFRKLETAILTEAAQEISDALTAGGVAHFVFKGAALIGRVYQAGDRDLVDMDIFVHPRNRAAGVERLRALGYEPDREDEQSGPAALRAGISLRRATGRTEFETVYVDVHWSVEPVEYFLPRPNLPLPEAVWSRLNLSGPFPVPSDEDHVALIIHHLVHHDLLHLRGLLDVAVLWEGLPPTAGTTTESVCRKLGVLRTMRALSAMLKDELGLPDRSGFGAPAGGWRDRRLEALLHLPRWFAWAGRAALAEHEMITVARFRRRAILVDRLGALGGLLRDALAPPREYLRWRWPNETSRRAAWIQHLRRVGGKVMGSTTE